MKSTLQFVFAFLCEAAFVLPCVAVSLDGGGHGQALIFPYFTVQPAPGGNFNTYISITNGRGDTKVLKVRFREGRNARPVADFNVYLRADDMWTATLVPDSEGTRLVTRDLSCTNPPIPAAGLLFSDAAYAAPPDGYGTDIGRLREGHVEVIEMATLGPAVLENLYFFRPPHCETLQGSAPAFGPLNPPTGSLSGSATLINVASGLDVSYTAEALANLTAAPMYANPGQPGADFDAPEVVPVTSFVSDDIAYRLTWPRGADAVTAALIGYFENEFVLDKGTASRTDWVVGFPTRRLHLSAGIYQRPFGGNVSIATQPFSCEGLVNVGFDREARQWGALTGFPEPPLSINQACWSTTVFSIRSDDDRRRGDPSDVLGSHNVLGNGVSMTLPDAMLAPAAYENGWITLSFDSNLGMVSQPSSLALDMKTGALTQASFWLHGLPATGFMARTLSNGTLSCGGQTCLAVYSAGLSHRRRRVVGKWP
jgi:hypothetical protein